MIISFAYFVVADVDGIGDKYMSCVTQSVYIYFLLTFPQRDKNLFHFQPIGILWVSEDESGGSCDTKDEKNLSRILSSKTSSQSQTQKLQLILPICLNKSTSKIFGLLFCIEMYRASPKKIVHNDFCYPLM